MVSGNVMLSVAVILSPSCSSGSDHNDHNTGSYHELQLAGEHRDVRDRDGGGPGEEQQSAEESKLANDESAFYLI